MSKSEEVTPFDAGFVRGTVASVRSALLLRPDVFANVSKAPTPSRRGFGILVLVLFVVSLTRIVGALFDVLTLPQLDAVQQTLYDVLTSLQFYESRSAADPGFAGTFETIYNIGWTAVRLFGGYPSTLGVAFSSINFFISNLFAWLTYGFIGFYVARALGAKVRKMGDYLGLMGLAFAPLLLYALEMIPGLTVPSPLFTLWFLATAYVAVRATYDTSWWRTTLIVILPFPINAILLTLVFQLGIAIGVAVSRMILA